MADDTAGRGSFRTTLDIEGWSRRSVWGYDAGMRTYFAQLWRDGDRQGHIPDIWLSGSGPRYARPEELFGAILAATHAPPPEVLKVLGGERDESGEDRPAFGQILAYRNAAAAHESDSPYLRGAAEALAWLGAEARRGPVTGQLPQAATPGPCEIEAERWAASAAVHQRRDLPQEWFTGIEAVLMWANGHAAAPW